MMDPKEELILSVIALVLFFAMYAALMWAVARSGA